MTAAPIGDLYIAFMTGLALFRHAFVNCYLYSSRMNLPVQLALAFVAAALAVQYASAGIALWRCRKKRERMIAAHRPPISIVRPLRGVEPFSRETLAATFAIEYPDYEILLCVADAGDPVVPIVRAAIAEHGHRAARLLIGEDALSSNPKLNNMAKGFRQARHGYIVFVDSNVLTPPDYLDQLAAQYESGAGMVSAPPVGVLPQGYWAQLECAFLNSYQARVQYAVDTLGFGFAQGKTLFFRRADLERGGLARLASEPAEDAAATKMMREKSRRIRLAGPFAQLIGPRTWAQMWGRQLRWARLRRASFPLLFAPEFMAGALPPLLAALFAAASLGLDVFAFVGTFLVVWYLPEIALCRAAGWPLSPSALVLRDLLLPAIYAGAWMGRDFEWHGRKMRAVGVKSAPRAETLPQRLKALWTTRAG